MKNIFLFRDIAGLILATAEGRGTAEIMRRSGKSKVDARGAEMAVVHRSKE